MSEQDRIEEQITRIIESSEDGWHESTVESFITSIGIDRVERMSSTQVEREMSKWCEQS